MPASPNLKQLPLIVINITINNMQNLAQELKNRKEVWEKISPTWPLRNLIACNPLQGFENMKFEEALRQGNKFFQNKEFPPQLETINQISIKWCQVFFDTGQATIKMPNRNLGFYKSWKELATFDDQIHQGLEKNIKFIKELPNSSFDAITNLLEQLNVSKQNEKEFLTAILTTLSGWSSYVKYLGEWSYQKNDEIESDYLAIRLAITAIIWPNAAEDILQFLEKNNNFNQIKEKIEEIKKNENEHQTFLLEQINQNKKYLLSRTKNFDAQLVFCIDVRSEPIRKALESCGNYETFGFAGFFGIPTAISNDLNKESYASCPVLLEPKHNIIQKPICSHQAYKKQIKGYLTIFEIKKFYQSLKYNFTTPLPLAEGMGIWSGGWMFIKTFFPKSRKFLQKVFNKTLKQNFDSSPEIDSIPFSDQCIYAKGALRTIGLIDNFSKIIVLCGHGSQTENNTYATALDCGACGGRHGDANAKILAKILNQESIRNYLKKESIIIPQDTKFIAAKHNTTTDEIEIYQEESFISKNLGKLKNDLAKAKEINNSYRAKEMGFIKSENISDFFLKRSHSWSETQAEWGLAKNASFIAAPRDLTKNINLEGRSFLHSYDWKIDEDNNILNLILNAPMIVAQWINSQYLFSTIDNVAFGSGSKITQNIVGKIGVMQGNASDLMNGLPLQSVYINDNKPYHKPARLLALIYAPSAKIDKVIFNSPKLQQLVVNEWIKISCLKPESNEIYQLQKDLLWNKN